MNQAMKGQVSKNFVTFTNDLNRAILEKAAEESKSIIQISDQSKNESVTYAGNIKCK